MGTKIMDYRNILVEKKNQAAWITLNRPKYRNQLSADLLSELAEALAESSSDPNIQVVILYGGPGKSFCAGADVSGLRDANNIPILHRREFLSDFVEILKFFKQLDKPTIAAVNGHAMGGGAGLIMACDFAIMSDQAKIGFPEVQVGFIPAIVMVHLLRLVPWRNVVELVLTGKMLKAGEAQKIYLVNEVVPQDQLIPEVEKLAGTLSEKSPTAMKLTKEVMRTIEYMDFDQSLAFAYDMNLISQLTEDFAEGVKAYTEKRPPKWTGI
jgi:enoyl-CoA hydratase/carnithine racemase